MLLQWRLFNVAVNVAVKTMALYMFRYSGIEGDVFCHMNHFYIFMLHFISIEKHCGIHIQPKYEHLYTYIGDDVIWFKLKQAGIHFVYLTFLGFSSIT